MSRISTDGKMEALCRRQLCVSLLRTSRYASCTRQFSLQYARAAKPSKKSIKPHITQLEYKPRPIQQNPQTLSSRPPPSIAKHRTIAMFVCGGIAFLTSSYIAFYGSKIYQAFPAPSSPSLQPDFSAKFNAIAPTFDLSIVSTEKYMGLPKKRKELVSQARGDVLEVSIGTGRNLEYYDWDFKGVSGVGTINGGKVVRGKVRSFTAVDASVEMLEVAHEKFSKLYPGVLGVRWVVGDASQDIPPPPQNANEMSGNLEGKKYDTVVQTMGLCSVKDPVALLRNLGNCVEEEEGRILLLEHGRGRWGWLNRYLDSSAEGHAREFGCWWNRDLGEIVRESGLEVVKIKRWHGGTTCFFELKKGRS